MNYNNIFKEFNQYKEYNLFGRYLEIDTIQKLILNLPNSFSVKEIGRSVNLLPIYAAYWGNGKRKILGWSQMHGNETTTTKALFDLVNYLTIEKESEFVTTLREKCKIVLVFVLNPDGAIAYSRLNANHVDLNRDAKEATQPEMIALQRLYYDLKPNLCLNLHGQRTIFSAGLNPKSATVSFLSPSVNSTRSLTSERIVSMQLISEMNTMLQDFIPNHVGRYDDSYNPNCIGDHFQLQGTPTILFEAGHFPNDYNREETRKFIFLAYIKLLQSFVLNDYKTKNYSTYFDIPKNQKLFYDFIFRSVEIDTTNYDLAVHYEEALSNSTIHFIPKLVQVNQLNNSFGHTDIIVSSKLQSINGERIQKLPSINTIIQEICTEHKVFDLKKL